jgi:sensor histidine kinase YesM
VRPYLEILKVRMEDRLQTEVNISEGLHSAEFPPMMLQSLVENAIKHGLEPKPEGGSLQVSAEIAHGKLGGRGRRYGRRLRPRCDGRHWRGLENIRERLKLLFGSAAELADRREPAHWHARHHRRTL